MKIGITEQGDAGLDFAWYKKLKTGYYDGAILITKNANSTFVNYVMDLYQTFPNILLHIGCTGLGGTILESHVPSPHIQLKAIETLIGKGFPEAHIVLRVDPIIPINECLEKANYVLEDYMALVRIHPQLQRVRISILDEYKHVKKRLTDIGLYPFYNGFYPSMEMQVNVINMLANYPSLSFETCAEDGLVRHHPQPNLHIKGCISETELKLFGLSPDRRMLTNMQNRNGCHCLSCKAELLSNKFRCPHQCVYCYWKDRK